MFYVPVRFVNAFLVLTSNHPCSVRLSIPHNRKTLWNDLWILLRIKIMDNCSYVQRAQFCKMKILCLFFYFGREVKDSENISLRCKVRHLRTKYAHRNIHTLFQSTTATTILYFIHRSTFIIHTHKSNIEKTFMQKISIIFSVSKTAFACKIQNMRGAYIFYNQIFILLNIILLVKMFTMCLLYIQENCQAYHDFSEIFTLRFGNVERKTRWKLKEINRISSHREWNEIVTKIWLWWLFWRETIILNLEVANQTG